MAVIHKTVPVQVWADVDEGLAALVATLNGIKGVRTHNCCQGSIDEGGVHPYPAYVSVSWYTEKAKNAIERFGTLCAEGTNHGTLYPSFEALNGLRTDGSRV